jgi:hypothetical protein
MTSVNSPTSAIFTDLPKKCGTGFFLGECILGAMCFAPEDVLFRQGGKNP